MNTTLCFRIIWILPIATLLTGCAGATATSLSFENDTDDSVPARFLPDEPSSTEGRQGTFQAITTKSGASPPEERTPPFIPAIAIAESVAEKMKPLVEGSMSAMVHAHTETAQVYTNKEATSTLQELWNEFLRVKNIQKLPDAKHRRGRSSLMDDFVGFVQDSSRKDRYLECQRWLKTNFGENWDRFTLDMVKTPTEQEADQIMSTLWKSFVWRRLPHFSPTIDRLDSYLQDLLKPKFFEFVRSDPKRSEKWIQWLNFKAGTEEALAKEALTPALVQQMPYTTTNVLSNALATKIIRELWDEFQPLLSDVRETGARLPDEDIFLTFVSLDPVRQAYYDEWRKWRITNFGLNGPEFTKEMARTPTKEEAHMIIKTLENALLQQPGISVKRTPLDLHQPDQLPRDQVNVPPGFKFIYGNHARSVKWMQWLNRYADAEQDQVAASIEFTSSLEAKVLAGLHRSILWSEFRQSWLRKKPTSRVPLTYDHLAPDLKRKLDGPFLIYVLQQRRRNDFLATTAKITQPAGSRKRPRDSSNSSS